MNKKISFFLKLSLITFLIFTGFNKIIAQNICNDVTQGENPDPICYPDINCGHNEENNVLFDQSNDGNQS